MGARTRRYGMAQAVPVFDREKLSSMSTKELLGRLERLRRCEDSLELSDMEAHEVERADGILFKDSPAWKRANRELKEILALREHIPTAAERMERRLAQATRARCSGRRRGR